MDVLVLRKYVTMLLLNPLSIFSLYIQLFDFFCTEFAFMKDNHSSRDAVLPSFVARNMYLFQCLLFIFSFHTCFFPKFFTFISFPSTYMELLISTWTKKMTYFCVFSFT